MRHINSIARSAVFWLALLAFGPALAEISITLNNSFIDKYKNRATIDAKFVVDHSTALQRIVEPFGHVSQGGRGRTLHTTRMARTVEAYCDSTRLIFFAKSTRFPLATQARAFALTRFHGLVLGEGGVEDRGDHRVDAALRRL